MTELMKRRGALMVAQGGAAPILPAEYQQVEYIKSSGTQYINTGVKYYKHTIYLDAQFFSAGDAIGSGVSGQQANKAFGISWLSTYGIVISANNASPNNSWCSGKNYGYNRFNVLSNDSNGNLVFNNVTYTPKSTLDTNQANTIPLWLFGRDWGGSLNQAATVAIYRCTIWNKTTGDKLIDLIPCYRKADDEIGMYDLVSETFKTNSGTGTFTKGNNV